MSKRVNTTRKGFSLMELLAVVTILGIIAAIIVPRVSVSTSNARQQVDAHNRATLNAAIERFFIESPTGDFPTALADLVPTYLPGGIPANPVNASDPYVLNTTTNRVDAAP